MSDNKMIEKVETMFAYGPDNVEEIKKLVTKIEGTEAFWHLVSVLVVKSTEIAKANSELEDRVRELEQVNERLGESFRNRNEYGF